MTESADPAALASALGDGAARLQNAVRRHLARSGVSLAGVRALAALDRGGPQRVTDLAAVEQVTQPSMSALIARLESQALVERTADNADGRSVIVSITAPGREALRAVLARRTQILGGRLEALAPADRDLIAGALPALLRFIASLEERPSVASRV